MWLTMCFLSALIVIRAADTKTNVDLLIVEIMKKYHSRPCFTLLTDPEFSSTSLTSWLTHLQENITVLWFQKHSNKVTSDKFFSSDLQKSFKLGCNTYIIVYPTVKDLILLAKHLGSSVRRLRGKIILHAPVSSIIEIDELFQQKLLLTNADTIFLRSIGDTIEIRTHDIPHRSETHVLDRFLFSGVFELESNLFYDKFNNLRGYTLNVTTFDFRPLIQKFPTASGYSYSGLEYSLLLAQAQAMNFTFSIKEPPNNELWGQQLANGTFTGLVGELAYGNTDIGFAGLYIQSARTAVMDYTSAYRVLYECFLAPLPSPSPRWMALVAPFDTWVWISTFLLFVISVVALYVIGKFAPSDSYLKNFSTVVYFIFSGLMQLQVTWSVKTDAVRMFLVGWFTIATIVPTVYKSMLTAYLSVPIKPAPIDTIQQLLNSPLTKGSFGDNAAKILKDSSDPTWRKLSTQLISYSDFDWAYDQLAKGKLVITGSDDYLRYLIKTKYTSPKAGETVHMVKQCLMPYQTGFGLQKYSPYRERMNEIFQRVIEGGLVNYWFEEALRDSRAENTDINSQEESSSGSSSSNLSLESLQGAYILLIIGYIISIVVFVLEIIAKEIKRKLFLFFP